VKGQNHPTASLSAANHGKTKDIRLAFTDPFDSLTPAVQEHGTIGDQRQSRWLRTADGFAVCGFRATLARYLLFVSGDG
jgi:hypothetical protein